MEILIGDRLPAPRETERSDVPEKRAYVFWVVALQLEAAPIITHFKLKRNMDESFWPVYQNDQHVLIVSGTGKTQAAMAAVWLLARWQDRAAAALINWGLCGTNDPLLQPGDLVLADKIADMTSGRHFYPDLYKDWGIARRTLECHDQPVKREMITDGRTVCVDMESAGIMEAARRILESHQTIVIKMISDHLEPDQLDRTRISELLAKLIKRLDPICMDLQQLYLGNQQDLPQKIDKICRHVVSRIQMSQAMQKQLRDLIRRALLNGMSGLMLLECLPAGQSKSKLESKSMFNEYIARIENALSHTLH